MKKSILLSLCILFIGDIAIADWDPTDPAKWVQLPDLNPTGINIYATKPQVLADDFLCTQTGPITDVHIWGCWFNGYLPQEPTGGNPSASNVSFTLSLHADIPANTQGGPGYSMPGEPLWVKIFEPGQFSVNLYHNGPEGWYNPNTGQYIRTNQVWQYNFLIDQRDAYWQEGSPEEPIVYWLDVSATLIDQQAIFGWRTSVEHWNDDAVWSDSHEGPWNELRYPIGHPYEGESIDLAFVITPEPTTIALLGFGLVFIRRRKS